jgi:hypothetical protein
MASYLPDLMPFACLATAARAEKAIRPVSKADNELFIELAGEQPIEVLATAHSQITGPEYPMAFVLWVGPGRVFHTPLGHDMKALRVPGTSVLIRRCAAWAAGRPVTVSDNP